MKYEEDKLISIIIPTYNSALYLDECLKSLINQTNIDHSIIEVVVVDDGSTDNTSELIVNYDYSFIQFYYKENSGVSSTRNFGVDKSCGKYLLFLDSDDVLEVSGLYKIITIIKKECADIISFSGGILYDDVITNFSPNYTRPSSVCNKLMSGSDFFVNSVNSHSFFVQPGMYCFKRELFFGNEFIEGILHEDNPFSLGIFLHESKMVYCLPDKIYQRRIRPNSIMTSSKTEKNAFGYLQSINYIVEKHYKLANDNEIKKSVRLFLFKLLRCAYVISVSIKSTYYKTIFLKIYNDFHPDFFEKIRFNEPIYFKAYNWSKRRLRKVCLLGK